MKPVRTPDCTHDLGDLPVVVEGNGAETRTISTWQPDEAERGQIAMGGQVALAVEFAPHPPVALAVVGPFCGNCEQIMQWSERLGIWVCPEPDDDEPTD